MHLKLIKITLKLFTKPNLKQIILDTFLYFKKLTSLFCTDMILIYYIISETVGST